MALLFTQTSSKPGSDLRAESALIESLGMDTSSWNSYMLLMKIENGTIGLENSWASS